MPPLALLPVTAAQKSFESVPPTPIPPGSVKKDRKGRGGKGKSRSRSASQGGKDKKGKSQKGKGKQIVKPTRAQLWKQSLKSKGQGKGKGKDRTVSINPGKDASTGAGSCQGQ